MKRLENPYISFNGTKCNDVGAYLIKMPQRQHTALTGKKVTIPGRDGFLLQNPYYKEITVKVDLFVPDTDNLLAVRAWLTGTGPLIFSDLPKYYYNATIMTVATMKSPFKRLEGITMTVTFTCQPFMGYAGEAATTLTTADLAVEIEGKGTVTAKPLITIMANGEEDEDEQVLTVGDTTFTFDITDVDEICIDCNLGWIYTVDTATLEKAFFELTMDGDWPAFEPGETYEVSFTGEGIESVEIEPRWRWI